MIKRFLRKASLGLLSGSLIFLSFTACDNNAEDEIGWDLTPPGEKFQYHVDSTTAVTAITIRQDSVTSDERATSLLGSINDPVFGKTTGHILAQLRLTSNEVDFGVNPVIDSARLLLKYKGSYGDTTTLQHFRIYELTKDIYADTTYYTTKNMTGGYDSTLTIADVSYYPTPSQDSLEIPVSNEWATKLLMTDTANLSDNATWLAFMKGIYIQSQPVDQGGAMVYYTLGDGGSRMIMYYHNDVEDSLSYEVSINSNSSWVNLFDHNYEGVPVTDKINDSVNIYPDVYLQSMGGLRSILKFQLPDSVLAKVETGVTINKAELIIPVASDPTASSFAVPASLRIYNRGTGNVNEYLDDLALGETYYGGTYDSETSSYRFNIARHIQNLVHPTLANRETNNGLILVITDERISANRVILKNGNLPGGMKLVLTYTPVK